MKNSASCISVRRRYSGQRILAVKKCSNEFISSLTANLRRSDIFKTLIQVRIISICILNFWNRANNTLCNFAKIMLLFSNHNVRNRSTLLTPYHNPREILVFLVLSIKQTDVKVILILRSMLRLLASRLNPKFYRRVVYVRVAK
jgi:hypothetical protein